MGVYLNEQQAGCDREIVGFPHLLLCMGVVLQTHAWLYGYHFDFSGNTPGNIAGFRDFLQKRGGNAANGVRLYGAANWALRYQHARDRGRAWRAEMAQIADGIGYRGRISGFNTGIIGPRDGTYVEYQASYGTDTCKIFYKRNEKMDIDATTYTDPRGNPAPHNPNVSTYNVVNDRMRLDAGFVTVVHGADVRRTDRNRGRLHELNYFLRLTSYLYAP